MKNTDELISVIIPAYNAEKFIARALDSLINQTCSKWQAIVINDGSSDATEEICRDYCSKDERIKLFTKENGGVSRARNTGLEKAEGKYICFLDADDFLEPFFLETLCNGFKENNCMISACGYTHSNGEQGKPSSSAEKYSIEKAFYLMCRDNIIHPFIWNKMFLSSVIRENCLQFDTDIIYGEDTLFLLKYYACAYDGSLCLNYGLMYHYCANPDSAMRKRKRSSFNDNWLDQIKALERASEYAGQKGLSDFAGAIKIRLCYIYAAILDLFVTSGYKGEEYKKLLERMRRELPDFLKSDLFKSRAKLQLRVCAISPKLKHIMRKLKMI